MAHQVHVFLLEANAPAGPLAACLLAGLAGPAHHRALAEGVEGADQHFTEAGAIGDQNGHGNDAPDNPEHGEEAAHWIAPQRVPGLFEDLSQHGASPARLVT